MQGMNRDEIHTIWQIALRDSVKASEIYTRYRFAELIAATEREKLQSELLKLNQWKGIALSNDGDGRTVQMIEEEARAAEREACATVPAIFGDSFNNTSIAAAIRARGNK